jgi:hypothetical protein
MPHQRKDYKEDKQDRTTADKDLHKAHILGQDWRILQDWCSNPLL